MLTPFILLNTLFSITLSVTPLGPWLSGAQASWHQYAGYQGGTACGYLNVATYFAEHAGTFPYDMVTAVGTVPAGSSHENLFDDGEGCGACFEIECVAEWANNINCFCNSGQTVIVQAIDLSGENSEPHFDIAEDGFYTIAGSQCGRIGVNYRRVACEFTSNIYITTDNNDAWSYYLNFYNVAGDGRLCGVELKSSNRGDNEWMQCVNVNSKWKCDDSRYEPTALPISFRLTDCSGNTITSNAVVTSYGTTKFDLGVNFPYTSTPTAPTTTTSSTTPAPTPSTTSTTSTTSTIGTLPGGDGCGVSNNWGAMKINPYWGSTASSFYAMISNPPASITSFEIRGADQNNNQFQQCVIQNTNAFQCVISGGSLTEPASIKLNGGAYYAIDIIESMTGSAALYPLPACSKTLSEDTTSTTTTTTTTSTTPAPTTSTTSTSTSSTSSTTSTTSTSSTSTSRASSTSSSTSTTTTTSSGGSGTNIKITNYGDSSGAWFYALKYSDVAAGYTVSKIEVMLSNAAWHTCDDQGWAVQCQTLPAGLRLPLSIRLTANGQTITGVAIVTDMNEHSVFDFGSNFGSSSGSTTTTTTTPAPTAAVTATSSTSSTSSTATSRTSSTSSTTTTTTTPAPTTSTTTTTTTSGTSSGALFVTYVGMAGPGWGTPGSNEDFLKYIGVPGYGEGSKGYNVINFAFWVSNSANGGAAANGAAYDWQNILQRITSSTLKMTLTGSSNPSADVLRAAIKDIYKANGIQLFISAFGGNDHPMTDGKSATAVAAALAAYAKKYQYDGADIDWEEGIAGKLGSNGGGETWLCSLTNSLRNALNADQKISHAPQAPYFRCTAGDFSCNYPNGGYVTVNSNCGDNIDWYNIQFYNQGSTKYDTYNELFVSSSGWSTNSAVYQMVDKGVPASKIVVGKHTDGDGSTFVSGAALKSIFNSAIASGKWSAGFMTWQFYREVAFGSSSLIDQVKNANWPTSSTSSTTTSTTSTTKAPTRSTPTTSTTKAPTTSTTSTTRVIGNGKRCLISNLAGSSSWWYKVSVTDCTDGVVIDKVYLKGRGKTTWEEGKYKSWSGGYYVFDDKSYQPYDGPLSFKIVSSSGQTIVANDILDDTTPDKAARMDSSFSAAYNVENNTNESGLDWTVIFAIIVCCLVVIGCIGVGIYCIWRQKKRGKAFFVDSMDTATNRGNGEHKTVEMIEEIEVEAQFEEDGHAMITQTND